ncbi:MAG: hypothetical protein AAGD23_12480 [Pseudomonadota bacterium]
MSIFLVDAHGNLASTAMQHGLHSYHPFSQFDLAAIGIALLVVMVLLALRRISRMVLGVRSRPTQHSSTSDD